MQHGELVQQRRNERDRDGMKAVSSEHDATDVDEWILDCAK